MHAILSALGAFLAPILREILGDLLDPRPEVDAVEHAEAHLDSLETRFDEELDDDILARGSDLLR